MPINDAVEIYIKDGGPSGLKKHTIAKLVTWYRKQLCSWAEENKLKYVDELTTARLTEWRTAWIGEPQTNSKRQERLSGFCNFCVDRGYVTVNHAHKLSKISTDEVYQLDASLPRNFRRSSTRLVNTARENYRALRFTCTSCAIPVPLLETHRRWNADDSSATA
jgi:hypothetical protein